MPSPMCDDDEEDEVQMNARVPRKWRKFTRHEAVQRNTTQGEIVVEALALYRERRGPDNCIPFRRAA